MIPSFFTRLLLLLFLLVAGNLSAASWPGPLNFQDAKLLLREHVYFDQHIRGGAGTLYCGCQWQWTGASGGRVDLASCGYVTRAQPQRARRIEWEHIVPASWFGRQRKCWQQGGRKNCTENDPLFSLIEADMHNLAPIIGEVNADRSSFRFGPAPDAPAMYGGCASRTDFKGHVFEPRREARGMVARVNFYMHDRYNLRMSKQQQQLFMQWDRSHPVTDWEQERNRRIRAITGQDNPFVTGARRWTLKHRNSGEGLRVLSATTRQTGTAVSVRVKGNRNSRIYHLPHCPNYPDVSPRNAVPFDSEEQARRAGFRKARNCP